MSDRHPHVRVTQLRNHRTIDVIDHRMNNALRMKYNLYVTGPDVEQKAGFDQFKPLVHHGGRINRDLSTHHPVRVGNRLLWSNFVKFVQRLDSERSTRTSQQDPPDLPAANANPVPGWHALKDSVMFAVDRQQFALAFSNFLHQNLPGHHQCFLVGQQNPFTASGR